MMFARIGGGGEKNIEPGFKVMKDEVNPNVLVYKPSPGEMTELFQSGQALIAVWGTGRVQAFANSGYPVDFVYPKEGAPILLASACPVAKATISPLAHEFIKTMISSKVQSVLAKEMGNGPVNKLVDVNMAELKMAPVGERSKLIIASRLGRDQRKSGRVDQALEPRSGAIIARGYETTTRNDCPTAHPMTFPRSRPAQQKFGEQIAVDQLSLIVARVSLLRSWGHRAAGKTTTLQMIAGFHRPTSGAITLEGDDLTAIKPSRRGLSALSFRATLYSPT
jgi:ABC-type multidrug transport system fused ATPase/permease subunit